MTAVARCYWHACGTNETDYGHAQNDQATRRTCAEMTEKNSVFVIAQPELGRV